MKKQIILFFALGLIFAFTVKADPVVTVEIDDVVKQPGTVLVPVYVDFSGAPGDGVGSIELTISFDNTVLTEFKTLKNITHGNGDWVFQENDTSGEIIINWSDYTDPTKTNGQLLDLEFEYAGGDSQISFVDPGTEGVTEIGGESDGDVVTATFEDGSITQAPPIPIALWSLLIGFGLISLLTLKRTARNR